MRELSMCSTAISTNKGPEICADILWAQIVAVDAPLIRGQLEQPAYDPLVPLVLLHPARHRRIPDSHKPCGDGAPSVRVRARDLARARVRRSRGDEVVVATKKARLFCCCRCAASLRVLRK